VGCKHFRPKKRKSEKLTRQDILDATFPGRIENRRKRNESTGKNE
jgi:hypothetical protein